MSVVNVTLGDGKKLNLPLGRQGENEVTAVVFDFSAWSTEFGSGTLSLSVQRHGDELPYAVTMTTSGTNATWTISELDTAYKGTGEAQVKYTVGTKVKKSAVYKFTVNKSLGQNGEYPSPGQTWQEEIEDELADVKQDFNAIDGFLANTIELESGTFADADGVTHSNVKHRIRNITPIPVRFFSKIEMPANTTDTMYYMWIFLLDKNLNLITTVYWTKTINLDSLSDDVYYINFAIKNDKSPSSDISSELSAVQNSMVVVSSVDGKIENAISSETIYSYDMQEVSLTWVDGYYVDAHEAPVALASTRYAVIDVQEGEKYWVQGTNYYSSAGYRVFNSSGTQLIGSNVSSNFGYVNEVITIPEGGAKLYIGTYLTSTNNILNFGGAYKLVENTDLKTYAKSKKIKWEAVGDSITATATLRSSDGNYQMPNYVDFVSEWLGINVVNRGSSGTGYITNNSGYSNTFVERSTTISADTDLVTFFGSFNDPYDASYAVGTISDEPGSNTLYGAIKACINNVYLINPSTQILLITPQPWASTNEVSGNRKEIAKNYVKAILDVGALYSVPVLDLYHESGMHPWDESFKNKYYYNNDGTHPLSTAHKEFIAPKIMAKIKEMFVL